MGVPSGKLTVCYCAWPFIVAMLVYQRVPPVLIQVIRQV